MKRLSSVSVTIISLIFIFTVNLSADEPKIKKKDVEKIVDVIEGEDHQVVHLLEKLIKESSVEGQINWERRFDHMQQHTGQHLLSQAFIKICDAETVSFHLGEESSTIDVNRSGLDVKIVKSVEDFAFEDHSVFRSQVVLEDCLVCLVRITLFF